MSSDEVRRLADLVAALPPVTVPAGLAWQASTLTELLRAALDLLADSDPDQQRLAALLAQVADYEARMQRALAAVPAGQGEQLPDEAGDLPWPW